MMTNYPILYAFTLIKDEQRYLDEWIEHNLRIGFNKIVLYEDYCSAPHDVSKYGDKVILLKTPECYDDEEKIMFYEHTPRQHIVYDHFNRVYRNECDWFCFIDVDEFIETDNVKGLIDENYDQLVMFFRYYSYSGHINDPYPNQVYSIVETYKDVLPDDTTHKIEHLGFVWKSIHRSSSNLIAAKTKYACSVPHCSLYITNKKSKCLDTRIAHYWTRSLEEYIDKLFKQGLLENEPWSRKLSDFFVYNDLEMHDYIKYIKDYVKLTPKTNEDY